ncbi:MAG: 3-dehydroquinate synthase [Clostridia bacterium]|nr:3-dehydroquinate synthase [Clostridia bacterium]
MIIRADSYDIIIEKGCLDKAGDYLPADRKALIVTDSGIPAEYAQKVLSFCAEGSIIKTVPQGEESKNFDNLKDLLRTMLEAGFTRRDCVIAVGGGVVGDLSGFAASIYMRGIDFYNIPTTLLSQVDSSVGGKTAIDFEGVKNIVGAFYPPKAVLIDENVLSTLPLRQLNNGLAEALKMSMTCDSELFDIFENGNPYENIGTVIEKSLLIKTDVVNKDEKEQGLRRVLNFGHTIGHGIEAEQSGRLYHGECVAIGMIPMCSPETAERLKRILKELGLPCDFDGDAEKVYEAMLHDKKSGQGNITAVFVDEPGSFRFESVPPEALKERIMTVVRGK